MTTFFILFYAALLIFGCFLAAWLAKKHDQRAVESAAEIKEIAERIEQRVSHILEPNNRSAGLNIQSRQRIARYLNQLYQTRAEIEQRNYFSHQQFFKHAMQTHPNRRSVAQIATSNGRSDVSLIQVALSDELGRFASDYERKKRPKPRQPSYGGVLSLRSAATG